MPTAKKKKAAPKKLVKKLVKTARTAKPSKKHSSPKNKKAVQKSRAPAAPVGRTAAKVLAPARTAPKPSNGCGEGCRVCGGVCIRGGMHEQHRCSEHAGLSL
jgi:hypothetical protein